MFAFRKAQAVFFFSPYVRVNYDKFIFNVLQNRVSVLSQLKRYKMQNKSTASCHVDNLSAPSKNVESALPPEIEMSTSNVDDNGIQMAGNDKASEAPQEIIKQVSKRSLKRQARAQQYKELKKRRKAENLIQTGREEAGYNLKEFDETSYYFENGLRKVYPYHYVFATYAKGRWVGRTLKEVLEKEFGFDQPEDVVKAFDQGKIHVNGVQVSVDYTIKDCDYISHQIHRHENPVTDKKFDILSDTDEVVVINKPSSIPCHPCGRYRFNSIVFILGKEMGYSNLRNIYRLDRLTSGVLILGKTAESTKRLEDQVVKRQVQKEYVCRVQGEFPCETVTVDQPLQALSNKLRLQVISPTGKSSQTTFTRISYNGRSSVVKCVPHTGRTHQIRVHLQYLGHPIINDVFYNSDAWGPNKGKGAVYQVPNDVVCSIILKRHQATQWEGGENPLFHKKLEEIEKNKLDLTQSKLSLSPSETTSKKATSHGDKQDHENLNSATNCLTHDVCNSDNIIQNPDVCETMSTTEKGFKSQKMKNSEIEISNVNMKQMVNSSNSDSGKLESCMQEKPGSSLPDVNYKSEANVSTSGFDWTRWQIDATCDLCRKTTIDPKPKDLVMFLHAWKYKGPGWEYQTELPDWAKDHWQNEDEFLLEPTNELNVATETMF